MGAVACLLVGREDGNDSLPSLIECHLEVTFAGSLLDELIVDLGLALIGDVAAEDPFTGCLLVGETALDLDFGEFEAECLLGDLLGDKPGVKSEGVSGNTCELLLLLLTSCCWGVIMGKDLLLDSTSSGATKAGGGEVTTGAARVEFWSSKTGAGISSSS